MKEIERLKLALYKSHSTVYEWDIEKDTVKWSGDTTNILNIDDIDLISIGSGFSNYIFKADKEKYQCSLDKCIKNGGDYTRSYRVCGVNIFGEEEIIQLQDNGVVVNHKGKIALIGTIRRKATKSTPDLLKKKNQKTKKIDLYADIKYQNDDFLFDVKHCFSEGVSTRSNSILLKISIDNLPMMMIWYTLEFAERVMSALEIELQGLVREEDIITRISVDQFGAILKNHSKAEAEIVINRILKHIQLYKNPSFDEPIHLRTSIGSVSFPANAGSAEDALNKVYLALSSAKSKSSEFYCDYIDAKREHLDSREQASKMQYMQEAFDQDRIKIAYQPVIESKTGKVKSYECLLRVADEKGNLSSAGSLIPIAEKMGVIDMVDQYVMEKIIEELKLHKDVTLAFNISNMTTDNPKWLKMCTKMLQNSDVASRLVIEITETAAQRDLRKTAYFVAALQALGCKVALDDFGAGYTSFRQLKSLSVDIVKIDGAYIFGLEENSENLMFIKTLLKFNKAYGLETVAECVESGEVAKILMGLNVDYMQGYYFGAADVARPWANERPPYELSQ